MLNGRNVSSDTEASNNDCTFCKRTEISYILKETPNFLLAADHAPLVEGHILIIPKNHFTCYGEVPPSFDEELFSMKGEVQRFFTKHYAPPVFWEHGIFKQTVFHAHLHCFPWSSSGYNLEENLHNVIVSSQDDIRQWFILNGHYFYMEDNSRALIFAPEMARYLGIVKNVFLRGIASSGGKVEWRSPQQRFEEGAPLIESMIDKWRSFQELGTDYVNKTSPR
jgi:diadenosine tetraphosphate (Ap4A) HIT family hydrolase